MCSRVSVCTRACLHMCVYLTTHAMPQYAKNVISAEWEGDGKTLNGSYYDRC